METSGSGVVGGGGRNGVKKKKGGGEKHWCENWKNVFERQHSSLTVLWLYIFHPVLLIVNSL